MKRKYSSETLGPPWHVTVRRRSRESRIPAAFLGINVGNLLGALVALVSERAGFITWIVCTATVTPIMVVLIVRSMRTDPRDLVLYRDGEDILRMTYSPVQRKWRLAGMTDWGYEIVADTRSFPHSKLVAMLDEARVGPLEAELAVDELRAYTCRGVPPSRIS